MAEVTCADHVHVPAPIHGEIAATVVVFCGSLSDGLDVTLGSIVSQSAPPATEILIVGSVRRQALLAHLDALSHRPWLARLRGMVRDDWDACADKGALIAGDTAVCLRAGDFLHSDALRQMSSLMERSGCDLVLAAAGIRTASGAMSRDAVADAFLRQPAARTVDIRGASAPALAAYLTRTSRNQVRFFHRRLLEGRRDSIECAILHEYVCEKRSASGLPRPVELDMRTLAPKPARAMDEAAPADPDAGPVWMIAERRGTAAEENGWLLFVHCVDRAPHVDCYFVINPGVAAPECDERYRSRILEKGDIRWSILIEQASHFIFTDSVADVLVDAGDLARHPDATCVYLTHGVLAYSPGVYQRRHGYFDLITCASDHDIEAAGRQWDHDLSRFAKTGLARWDALHGATAKREILFSPTWRKSLGTDGWAAGRDPTDEDVEAFRESDYHRHVSALIRSDRLLTLLRTHGLVLNVALHFRVRHLLAEAAGEVADVIRFHDPDRPDRNLQALMKDAALLITDYSSVMWDMAFMDRPVLLYQFDKSHMLRERQLSRFHLREPDMPFDVCHAQGELLDRLEHYAQTEFRTDPAKRAALDAYLPVRDDRNRERIVAAIEAHGRGARGAGARADMPATVPDDRPLDAAEIDARVRGRRAMGALSAYLAHNLAQPVTGLTPGDWRARIEEERPELFLIEPNLDAAGPWSGIFFDPERVEALLLEAAALCARTGTELVLIDTPWRPYRIEGPQGIERLGVGFEHRAGESAVDISIIVPVHDSAEFVEDCLLSLVGQDFTGTFEVIAVDDGSSDGSVEVIRAFARRHPNVRLVRQPNARQGMARNHGVQVAAGRYVTFVDADDILTPSALTVLHHSCRLHDADISAGLYCSYNVDSGASFLNQSGFPYLMSPDVVSPGDWVAIFQDCSCVAKLIRRDLLLEGRIAFSGSFHEDETFTSLLFAEAGRISVVREVVYIYKAHGAGSATRRFDTEKLRQILLVGNFLRTELARRMPSPEAYDFKMAHLLQRYDRFLFKMATGPKGPGLGRRTIIDVIQRDGIREPFLAFLDAVPDALIERAAVQHGPAFLLLKRREFDLASSYLEGRTRAGVLHLYRTGIVEEGSIDRLTGLSHRRSSYDYYERFPVRQTHAGDPPAPPEPKKKAAKRVAAPKARPAPEAARDERSQSIKGSFRYQVGNLVVDAVARPGRRTVMLPISLLRLYRQAKRLRG